MLNLVFLLLVTLVQRYYRAGILCTYINRHMFLTSGAAARRNKASHGSNGAKHCTECWWTSLHCRLRLKPKQCKIFYISGNLTRNSC